MLPILNDLVLTVAMTMLVTSSCMMSLPLTFRPGQHQPCDVTVWDATSRLSEKVVHSVSAECPEGRVTWRLPYGGLRIQFSPTSPVDDDDDSSYFDVCMVVTASYCDVKLSADDGDTLRTLAVLKSSASTSPQGVMTLEEVCFASRGHRRMSLYAESLHSMTSHIIGRVIVDYDVRSHVTASRDTEDCRPCDDEELLMAACLSDFTIEARMMNVTTDNVDWTSVTVSVLNVIHQTSHFADLLTSKSRDSVARSHHRNTDRRELFLTLRTRAVCQVHYGEGTFLFVGKVRLRNSLQVLCAPRFDYFRSAWFTAVERDLQPCSLPVT